MTLSLCLVPFLRYLISKLLGFDLLTITLQRSPEVKNISVITKLIHDFLYTYYWHFHSISYRFRDIRLQNVQGLTFRGHLRSKLFSQFESSYKTFYLTSIDTFYLVLFPRYSTSKFVGFDLDLRPSGYLRSKIFSLFESLWTTSYLTSIDTSSLSRIVLEIFDFKVSRVWPWPLIFRGHMRSTIFLLLESSYMTHYQLLLTLSI